MHSILLKNNKLSLENEEVNISYETKSCEIDISGYVTIYEKSCSKTDLTFNLKENSVLVYNKFTDKKESRKITFNNSFNSKSIYKDTIISKYLNDYEYNVSLNSKAENKIIIRAITKDDGQLNVLLNGHVLKDTINTKLTEDIKVINLNDKLVKVIPNMIIDSYDTSSNHYVTIGNINNLELNYLKGKGLSENIAKRLIITGFLESNLEFPTNKDFQEIINKEV